MVEVFKTNVIDPEQANALIGLIHKTFVNYRANFDLDDCDKILRIQCDNSCVQGSAVISLLNDMGFYAEVLPDDDESGDNTLIENIKAPDLVGQ